MRCTVDGLTANCSAMTRMPGRPGGARALLIRSSSSGTIRGRPSRFPPALSARARPVRTRSRTIAKPLGDDAITCASCKRRGVALTMITWDDSTERALLTHRALALDSDEELRG